MQWKNCECVGKRLIAMEIKPIHRVIVSHSLRLEPQEHIRGLYSTFEDAVRRQPLDGLILTGAPVEEIPFEQVKYWTELSNILPSVVQPL